MTSIKYRDMYGYGEVYGEDISVTILSFLDERPLINPAMLIGPNGMWHLGGNIVRFDIRY